LIQQFQNQTSYLNQGNQQLQYEIITFQQKFEEININHKNDLTILNEENKKLNTENTNLKKEIIVVNDENTKVKTKISKIKSENSKVHEENQN
jgi:hypothetical protein